MTPTTTIQKVLMVDDDPNIRFITEMSLQGLTSWQVLLAGSGDEALELISTNCPDLALLDVMMPGMDGPTLFEKIKAQCGADKMPLVIFMTAKVQTQEVEAYKNQGAIGVITKPFDPMKLPQQIQEILNSA